MKNFWLSITMLLRRFGKRDFYKVSVLLKSSQTHTRIQPLKQSYLNLMDGDLTKLKHCSCSKSTNPMLTLCTKKNQKNTHCPKSVKIQAQMGQKLTQTHRKNHQLQMDLRNQVQRRLILLNNYSTN